MNTKHIPPLIKQTNTETARQIFGSGAFSLTAFLKREMNFLNPYQNRHRTFIMNRRSGPEGGF